MRLEPRRITTPVRHGRFRAAGKTIPGRAVETLTMLGVLPISSIGFVPGQSVFALGYEILAIGIAARLVSAATNAAARNESVPGKKWAPVLRALAGAAVFVWRPVGLLWLLQGVIFCLIAGS
jgi:hypothetical protein